MLVCAQLRFTNSNHPEKVFIFEGLQGEQGKFVYTSLFGATEEVLADGKDFKKWRPTKATIPSLCPDEVKALFGFECPVITEYKNKVAAESMLYDKYMQHCKEDLTKFNFAMPSQLYANAKFAVGKLKLLPLGTLTKVKDISKANILVQYGGSSFNLTPFPALKVFEKCFSCTQAKHQC